MTTELNRPRIRLAVSNLERVNHDVQTTGLYATRAVWELSLDGMLESIGSVDELGWYACYIGPLKGRGPFYCIVSENSQGFVHGQFFDSHEALDAAWAQIETMYDELEEERGEE